MRFSTKAPTLTYEQKRALLKYNSSESYKINSKLINEVGLTIEDVDFMTELDEALEMLPIYKGR